MSEKNKKSEVARQSEERIKKSLEETKEKYPQSTKRKGARKALNEAIMEQYPESAKNKYTLKAMGLKEKKGMGTAPKKMDRIEGASEGFTKDMVKAIKKHNKKYPKDDHPLTDFYKSFLTKPGKTYGQTDLLKNKPK
tara:strand:+ start:1100 stop:1510 length:411 start_codon:yes stop_codon:yes gene_type:complete